MIDIGTKLNVNGTNWKVVALLPKLRQVDVMNERGQRDCMFQSTVKIWLDYDRKAPGEA
jgi:hypothetical protein